ncbi:alpha/beta fold hydrolase [Planosporangium mesophilum]|uniref:Hydrolase n=1 Tax=Planosporangium mesophilum TaxID=689768 RepID=A0A8J3X6V7_9ACTN|nr:alpha/beta hydrolase [Planosporangium mesophilum]NJC86476.1 alpha/beta hydrolase [Planosporangium mesophilum]GII26103.1 hydrolase [Planosporangium mesophilum]
MEAARLAPEDVLPASEGITPAWPGRSVAVDGANIHVRDTPGRSATVEPAVYVHGLGGSSLNWTDLAGLLADYLDGQAIDLPGFGRSDPARSYTVTAFADRVIRWIEHSDRGPVHLFGNSLGGAVAVCVAGTRPELLRSLTLVSPAMPFLDPRRSFHGRLLPLLLIPRADWLAARRLAAIDPADLARMVIESCFADPSRFPEQRFAEAVEEARLRYTVPEYTSAYVRTLRSLILSFVRAYLPGSASLWQVARRISTPTLVIGGQRDMLVDVRVAAQVARTIPDSRLLTLHDVGHVAQMEAPRMVARAVLGMLSEASSVKLVPRTGASERPKRARRNTKSKRDIPFGGGITPAGEAAG